MIFAIGKLEKIKLVFSAQHIPLSNLTFTILKGIRLSVWETKDLNIGGNNITRINFVNVGTQVKFIDTLKHYQKSLEQLAQTVTEEEKKLITKITKQFPLLHDYFSNVWQILELKIKEKILEISSDGKGIIPYGKRTNSTSLYTAPENGIFFKKGRFYSDLKQISVSDEE